MSFEEAEKIFRHKTYGAIIPHAGMKYAGDARRNVFIYLPKNANYIIYIATLHSINKKDKVYILHNDTNFSDFPLNFTSTLNDYSKNEHSFKWVETELRYYFPKAKILALAPTAGTNLDLLSEYILQFMKQYKNSILLATADLIHYGKDYNTSMLLKYPQQLNKQIMEEELILNMMNIKINKTKNILKNKVLTCGPNTIITFLKVAKKLKWCGKVVDYYDSYGVLKKDFINRYTIDYKPVKSFVSYVSIIYGNYTKKDLTIFLPLDILLAIGLVKSEIMKSTMQNNYKLTLPKWSPLYHREQGIFVGTEVLNKNGFSTNCSTGFYENKLSSMSNKIVGSSENCYNDALQRWKIPYHENLFDNMSYKVELLDPESNWNQHPSHLAPNIFKLDGKHGMLLHLPNNKSATFLPVVVRNSPIWNIEDYMERLSLKAGGNKLDWKNKNSMIKIYKTKSFKWNPLIKIIEIN